MTFCGRNTRRVPVVEAVDWIDALLLEPHEQCVLIAARGTPRGKDVHEGHFALEVDARQPRTFVKAPQ